jgi:hypothetical protein
MKRNLNKLIFFFFSFFLLTVFLTELKANPPKKLVKLGFIAPGNYTIKRFLWISRI